MFETNSLEVSLYAGKRRGRYLIGGKGGIQGDGERERERERNTWVREFKEVCQNVRESKEERERERERK